MKHEIDDAQDEPYRPRFELKTRIEQFIPNPKRPNDAHQIEQKERHNIARWLGDKRL